ncbi:MAG: hypothetical protein NT027_14750 [Proteobacteria bacterium]|nr:hypothetical protein [Pseudomonadota bacterium]
MKMPIALLLGSSIFACTTSNQLSTSESAGMLDTTNSKSSSQEIAQLRQGINNIKNDVPGYRVRVTPKSGSATNRDAYLNGDQGQKHFVYPEEFVKNLEAALENLDKFIETKSEFEVKVSNWSVRSSDVLLMMRLAVQRFQEDSYDLQYSVTEGVFGYEGFWVRAKLRNSNLVKVMTLFNGNDEDHLTFQVADPEKFSKIYGGKHLVLHKPAFFDKLSEKILTEKSIYPGIEIYDLCLPECRF